MTLSTTVVERDLEVGALTLHVSERGSGQPLVVIHHSTGPFWTPFYDSLAARFLVIAPDMPGYGRSSRPDTARHPSHVAVLLGQLADALGHPGIHLVGLGLGGWVAAEMAAMNQRRLLSLTVVGAAGIKPRHGTIHDPMMESFIAYMRASFRDDAAFHAFFGDAPSQAVMELWDYSREMTARVTWKPWMWSLPLPDLLRAVATPALVVRGAQDNIIPQDCAVQYAEALGNARLEVIEDSGHVVDFERPTLLADMITTFIESGHRED